MCFFTDKEEDDEEEDVFVGLTADEVAGVSAGIVVIIIILITFSLLLCVFVTVWRRRRAAGKPGKQLCSTLRLHAVKLNIISTGLFRSRSRQSKSSHSSERRIFHAAR